MKVNILGTEYKIIKKTLEENTKFEFCDGYCDPYTKKIHIREYTDVEIASQQLPYGDRKAAQRKVLRHEILHAMFFESGLWHNGIFIQDEAWNMNEEMIDWFAIQTPKIYKVYEELGILE